MVMSFYKVHEYFIALIKIMLKKVIYIPNAPATTPSLIPVLFVSYTYFSNKIMIICSIMLSFVEVDHIAIELRFRYCISEILI